MGLRLSPFLVLLMTINNFYQVLSEESPVVESTLGTIRGVLSEDGNVNMFMGIPYATVNESNPFGAAIPHPGFQSVYEAYDDSAVCPQIEEFNQTIVGDIDCLKLNVYTPSTVTTNSRLPVFFWIYGGGFSIGFYGRFMYGPKYLVRNDIILVTINYRLGPYGFMCLDIPEIPGNQGLKDTLIALRWVKEHIHSFGGDPNQITLGGNSAGAVASDYHMIRQKNDEMLFNKAILQSGTMLLAMNEPDKNYPLTLAGHLNYQTDNIYDAISYLATVPPFDLIEAASTLDSSTGPCIENEFEGIEAFLTETIMNNQNQINNVDVMVGFTDDEMLFAIRANPSLNNPLSANNVYNGWLGASEVRQFYFGDDVLEENTYRGALDLYSDNFMVYPIHQRIPLLLDDEVKSLYLFMFAHDGNRNFVKYRESLVGDGAAHADELGYLFDMDLITEETTHEDQLVVDKMTTMWANFVKYGNPTPEITDLLDVVWEPITKTSPLNCMVIAPQLFLSKRPFHDRMAFLDLLNEINEQ